ncbi:MAG: hypothetical protein RM368_23090 [Nostoc sp. DedSLP03]|nr:hypothetical protein [Nostoc sp. DedSLP03]MDZ7967803.1 hypothetical protein [Nostoc sp. DedSLP03]
MSGKIISDVYDGLRLRNANTKGDAYGGKLRTPVHPTFTSA